MMSLQKIPIWIRVLIVSSILWITVAIIMYDKQPSSGYQGLTGSGLTGSSLSGSGLSTGKGLLGKGLLGKGLLGYEQGETAHISTFDYSGFLGFGIIPLIVIWGIVWIFYDKINKRLRG